MTSLARKYLFATLAFLAAAALAVGQVALADDKEPPKRTITMSGKGTIRSTPDKVTVSAGVESQAPTAKDVLAKNTAAMTRVVDALKSAGIDPKDIQTTDFSVNPQYEDRDDDKKPPRIVGYSVDNMVYVTMHDTSRIGAVLDQLVQAGSNSIGGVYFSVDKPEELEKEARKLAIADAIAKAKLYAEATGAELGPGADHQRTGRLRALLSCFALSQDGIRRRSPRPDRSGDPEHQYRGASDLGAEIAGRYEPGRFIYLRRRHQGLAGTGAIQRDPGFRPAVLECQRP